MELTEKVKGKSVGVDTSIFIYFIEKSPDYNKFLRDFFKMNENGDFEIVTSTITLLELLVMPFKQSRLDLGDKYKKILEKSGHIELINLNPEIAEISAKIKAKNGIRTPDAIQIGTSIYCNTDYFFTNDRRLKLVKEIPVIMLNDYISLTD